MDPSAGDDNLIAALKRRLRGGGGPEPKDQYIRLAVSLARDPSLVPTTVCKAAVPPVTSSGTRERILGYRDQIDRDGLLAVCSSQTSAQPVDPAAALEPEAQRRMKKAKQRHNQRKHWAELRALISELIDQVATAQAPVTTTFAHSASPLAAPPATPEPTLPSQQPAMPSPHITSSPTQRFSGVGQYAYTDDGQLRILPTPTLRCWRRGSADNKRHSFYPNGTQWSSGFWHVPPGLDVRAYEHQLEEVLGELHHLRDEECMLRGKIVAASAIESAIQQYEASACPQSHTRSQDQLERDLGLALNLEACILDYLRVIDEHAEEVRRMRDHWHDPASSDDEYDYLHADDHSPMNSDRACSPMDYHEL